MKELPYMKLYTFSIIILFLFLLLSCSRTDNFPVGSTVFCDAEQLNEKKDKFVSTNDSPDLLTGGKQQSSKEAYSGKFSVQTFPQKRSFAFGYNIKNAGPDWYFKVSVWRKSKDGKGALVSSANNAKLHYQATTDPTEKNADGWEKLEMEVYTPPNFGYGELKFYVWNNGSDTVYFDDLRIERLDKKVYPDYNEPPLVLLLDTSD